MLFVSSPRLQLQNALGSFGLTGLDRLLSFMIVTELQNVCSPALSVLFCFALSRMTRGRPTTSFPLLVFQYVRRYTKTILEDKATAQFQAELVGCRCLAKTCAPIAPHVLCNNPPLPPSPTIFCLQLKALEPLEVAPESLKVYQTGLMRMQKLWAPFVSIIMRVSHADVDCIAPGSTLSNCLWLLYAQVGQMQLIRRHIAHELNFAAKFDSKFLAR